MPKKKQQAIDSKLQRGYELLKNDRLVNRQAAISQTKELNRLGANTSQGVNYSSLGQPVYNSSDTPDSSKPWWSRLGSNIADFITEDIPNTNRMLYEKIVQGFDSDKLEKMRELQQERQDADLIKEYRDLSKQLQAEIDFAKNLFGQDSPTSLDVSKQTEKIKKLRNRLSELDNYFQGEGKSHPIIAENMYNLDNMNQSDVVKGYMNKGLQDDKQGGLSGFASFLGNTLQVGDNLFDVAGDYVDKLATSIGIDHQDNEYMASQAIQNIPVDDPMVRKYYKGSQISSSATLDDKLNNWTSETDRSLNKLSQEYKTDLYRHKKGLLHIPLINANIDIQDSEDVSPEWRKEQEEHNSQFWHPLYVLPEVGSSIGMGTGMVANMGISALSEYIIRKIPSFVIGSGKFKALKMAQASGNAMEVSKALSTVNKGLQESSKTIAMLQTGVRSAEIASNLKVIEMQRKMETNMEAADAAQSRTLQDAKDAGADLGFVYNQINEFAKKHGISTDRLNDQEMVGLALAYGIKTGDAAFDNARAKSQDGLQKLVNGNNSLAVMDYLEVLPFLGYGEKVLQEFGKGFSGAAARMRLPRFAGTEEKGLWKAVKDNYRNDVNTARAMDAAESMSRGGTSVVAKQYSNAMQAVYDSKIDNIAKSLIEGNHKVAGLALKHTSDYARKTWGKLYKTMALEGIEEGQQELLQNRYQNHEYDGYDRPYSMLDIPEVFADVRLGSDAISSFLGLRNEDNEQVRKAMLIGALAAGVFPLAGQALTGIGSNANSNNMKNLVLQLKNDWALRRLIGNHYGEINDDKHLDIFYDAFRKAGVDGKRITKSLLDLKSGIDEGHGLVKPEYIDGDIKLANAAYLLFNDKEASGKLNKEFGFERYSDAHREFVKQGAKAIIDANMTAELIKEDNQRLNQYQRETAQKLKEILQDESTEGLTEEDIQRIKDRKAQLRQENPQLAIIADAINKRVLARKNKIAQSKQLFMNVFDAHSTSREDFLKNKDVLDYVNNLKKPAEVKEDARKRYEKDLKEAEKNNQPFVADLSDYENRVMAEYMFDNKDKVVDNLDNYNSNVNIDPENILYGYFNMRQLEKIKGLRTLMQNKLERLKRFQKITGVDVSTDRLEGMVDALNNHIAQLEEREADEINGRKDANGKRQSSFTYKDYFGDLNEEFDDEQNFSDIIEELALNKSIFGPQSTMAAMFMHISGNPEAIHDAIYGANSTEDDLYNLKKQYTEKKADLNSKSELERSPVDEYDLEKLQEKAALNAIKAAIEEKERRKSIAHRMNEEAIESGRDVELEQAEQEEKQFEQNTADSNRLRSAEATEADLTESDAMHSDNSAGEAAMSDAERKMYEDLNHVDKSETDRQARIDAQIEARRAQLDKQNQAGEDSINKKDVQVQTDEGKAAQEENNDDHVSQDAANNHKHTTIDAKKQESSAKAEEQRKQETIDKEPVFNTDYIYDKEMSFYGGSIHGTLKGVVNGTAIYVDEDGQPTILLAGKSDHQFIGIFREPNSNKWSIKMENKQGDKSEFKAMMYSVMRQLPKDAEIYERTSISVDGLRVFSQQLDHGFMIGNDTYNTVLNVGDINNVFGATEEQQDSMSDARVNADDIEKVKSLIKPFLDRLGVRDIDNVVKILDDGRVQLTLPVLVKMQDTVSSDLDIKDQQNNEFKDEEEDEQSDDIQSRIQFGEDWNAKKQEEEKKAAKEKAEQERGSSKSDKGTSENKKYSNEDEHVYDDEIYTGESSEYSYDDDESEDSIQIENNDGIPEENIDKNTGEQDALNQEGVSQQDVEADKDEGVLITEQPDIEDKPQVDPTAETIDNSLQTQIQLDIQDSQKQLDSQNEVQNTLDNEYVDVKYIPIEDYSKLHYKDGALYYEDTLLSEEQQYDIEAELQSLTMFDVFNGSNFEQFGYGEHSKENGVSEDDIANYVANTFFYAYNEMNTPMKLTVGGKQIKTKYDLRPGGELAKKLVNKNWLKSCNVYYVVTQSQQSAKNSENDPDTFTVSMIIEDNEGKACYAASLRQLGKSISTEDANGNPLLDQYGHPMRLVVDNEAKLRNWLERVRTISDEFELPFPDRNNYKTDGEYSNAVNEYNNAKRNTSQDRIYKLELRFAQASYELDHPDDRRPDSNDPKKLAIWEAKVKRWYETKPSRDQFGSDSQYKLALEKYNRTHQNMRNRARWALRKPGRAPISQARIDQQIDNLRKLRMQIIDAYLTKRDGKYIFPSADEIKDDVRPGTNNISQSNGRFDNVKFEGQPVFRTIDDRSMDELSKDIMSGNMKFGIGQGLHGNDPFAILSLNESATTQYSGRGLSGKIYWMVEGTGERIPVMLSEEKFNTQERVVNGETQNIPVSDNVVLCIDNHTGEIIEKDGYKPSAAELILYLITGRLNKSHMPSADVKTMQDFARFFINCDPKTLLSEKERNNPILSYLASKQFAFEKDNDGIYKLTIGILRPNGSVETKSYSIQDLFENDAINEGSEKTVSELNRIEVITAISRQMHWNTEKVHMTNQFSNRQALGSIIDSLRSYFDNNPSEEVFKLGGLDQFTFRKSDLFEVDENGAPTVAKNNVNVLAWMIKNGKLKTDVSEQIFRDPFVFGTGVQSNPANKVKTEVKQHADEPLKDGSVDLISAEVNAKLQNIRNRTRFKPGITPQISTKEDILDAYSNTKIGQDNGGAENVYMLDYKPERDLQGSMNKKIQEFIKAYNSVEGHTKIKTVTQSPAFKNSLAKLRQGRGVVTIVVYKNGQATALVKSTDNFDGQATGVFSNTKSSVPFNEQQARKWVADTLGLDDDNYIVINGLIKSCKDYQIYGLTNIALDRITNELMPMIVVSRLGGMGVTYHEAWHYVNLLLHNAYARKRIWDEYRNQHPELKNATNAEVEEHMAEDFRNYMEIQTATGVKGSIKRLYNNVLDLLLASRRKAEYRHVFKSIRKGNYKGTTMDQSSINEFRNAYKSGAPEANYSISGISQEVLDKMTSVEGYRQFYDIGHAIVNYIIDAFNMTNIQEIKKYATGKAFRDILEEIKNFAYMQADPVLSDQIMDFYNNPKAFQRILFDELSKFGIKAKIKTLRQVKNQEEGAGDDATAAEDQPDNTWDKFDLSISRKDNCAFETKMFFSRINMYHKSYLEDGTSVYDQEVDMFGNARHYTFGETWTQLIDSLWMCESYGDLDENGQYKNNSIRGMVKNLVNVSEFWYSVDKMLDTIDDYDTDGTGENLIAGNTTLKSQIFSTLNGSKNQVAHIRIQDPITHKQKFSLDVVSFRDPTLGGNNKRTTGDRDRSWQMLNDNYLRAIRRTPARWSKNLVLNGILDANGTISNAFVNATSDNDYQKGISTLFNEILADLSVIRPKKKSKTNSRVFSDSEIMDLVENAETRMIPLLQKLGIDSDLNVLDVYINLNAMQGKEASAQIDPMTRATTLLDILQSKDKGSIGWFVKVLSDNVGNNILQLKGNTVKAVDEIYNRFKPTDQISLLALAHNTVHPSSTDFSVFGPDGGTLYPFSMNNTVSDMIRWLNTTNGDRAREMMKDPYCRHSIIAQAGAAITDQSSKEQHIKLNSFVGMRDVNKRFGVDYFGITPLEDYLAKMFMTENDQLVLPTMADKKTWYSIQGGGITLSHDLLAQKPSAVEIKQAVYQLYDAFVAQSPTEEDRKERYPESENSLSSNKLAVATNMWKDEAVSWYKGLDENSREYQAIQQESYRILASKGVNVNRFSDRTIDIFVGYFKDELESLLTYYSKENIKYLVDHPNARIKNFHGKVKNGRLQFGGNGGMFRYFYDLRILSDGETFSKYRTDPTTDSEGNVVKGTEYNLNQRLEYLFKLQQKIESSKGVEKQSAKNNLRALAKKVGLGDISDDYETDGFELIRTELESIKKEFFGTGSDIETIRNIVNDYLINDVVKSTLDSACDETSSTKTGFIRDGVYCPNAIPSEFLQKYIDMLTERGAAAGGVAYSSDEASQMAYYSLMANYAINTVISTIEFEKIFSGDPAFYKWSPLMDKNGQIVDTKLKITEPEFSLDTSEEISVGNIADKWSDKIKRLGGLLSPGSEIRLDYSKAELKKYPDLKATQYTNLNVDDIEAKSVFLPIVERNFKTQLLVNYIQSNGLSMFDEYKKQFEQEGRSEDIQQKIAINALYSKATDEEVNEMFNSIPKEDRQILENDLKSQLKPYQNITVSDAQVLIRPELYRKIRIGLGTWTTKDNPDVDGYSDEEAYEILEKDASWMNDPEKATMVSKFSGYVLKMSYFQNNNTAVTSKHNLNLPIYNKMAIFPMFKFMATGEIGKKVLERMEKPGNELDMISFTSAVKVGCKQNMYAPYDSKTDNLDQMNDVYDGISFLDCESDCSINYETDEVTRNEKPNTLAVQIQKLSCLRMQLNTEAHEATERNIGTQMFKIAFANILDDELYATNKKGQTPVLGSQLKADIMACINAMSAIGYKNVLDSFYHESKHGLEVDYRKVENFIKRIVENNGLGSSAQEIVANGNTAASLMSRIVFEHSTSSVVNSEVVDIRTHGGSAIQQSIFGFNSINKSEIGEWNSEEYSQYNGGQEIKWLAKENSMQVILSLNFFRDVVPIEYQDTPNNMRKWLFEHNIIGKNSKPFGIGYRIPTQGQSSMFAFQVADVLPETAADTIIVPREFTAQTGSDFDIDKLFIATMSYTNGVLDEFEDSENITKATLPQHVKQKLYIKSGNLGAIQNRLLRDYINVITDIRNFSETRAAIDVLTNEIKSTLLPKLRKGSLEYAKGMVELTPQFQSNEKQQFSTGKDGIAPFALSITNLSLTQFTHLTLDYGDNIFGFGDLDAVKGQDGRYIADWLSAMVNAHVDVAKDPYVYEINVNKFTYNHASFLIRAGKGISTFTFLAQPLLKQFASNMNISGGIYGNNVDGTTPQKVSLNAKKNKYRRQLMERCINEASSILKEKGKVSEDVKAQINEMAAYLSAKNKSNKTSFDYKRMFDKEEGLKAIENYNNPNASKEDRLKAVLFQFYALDSFAKIDKYAENLSQLVQLSQIDTKKFGNTVAKHINFKEKLELFSAKGDGWIIKAKKGQKELKGNEALQYYFNSMYLNDKFYKASRLVRDILSCELYTATKEFNAMFRTISMILNGEVNIIVEEDGKVKTKKFYNPYRKEDTISAISDAIDSIMRYNVLANIGYSTYQSLTNINRFIKYNKDGVNQSYLFKAGKQIKQQNRASRKLINVQKMQKGAQLEPIDYTMNGDVHAAKEYMKELIFGTKNKPALFTRVNNFLKVLNTPDKNGNYKYADYGLIEYDGTNANEFLTYLNPQAPSEQYPIGRILLSSSQMNQDQDVKQRLRSAFYQILTCPDQKVRQLGRDLAFYAYYSNYDQNNPNSFMELVPTEFRQQYDSALKHGLRKGSKFLQNALHSITDASTSGDNWFDDIKGQRGLAREYLAIMSRNFWFNDDIVAPYAMSASKLSAISVDENKQRRDIRFVDVRNDQYGVLEYGIIMTQSTEKPYMKVVNKGCTTLYKKIGDLNVKSKELNSKGTPKYNYQKSIYIAIPKAGLHVNNNNQYEFYADYGELSIFPQNKIPSEFNPNNLISILGRMIDDANTAYKNFITSATLYEQEVPSVYSEAGDDLYLPSQTSNSVNMTESNATRLRSSKNPESALESNSDIIISIDDNTFAEKDESKNKTVSVKFNDNPVPEVLNLINPESIVSEKQLEKLNREDRLKAPKMMFKEDRSINIAITGMDDVEVSDDEIRQELDKAINQYKQAIADSETPHEVTDDEIDQYTMEIYDSLLDRIRLNKMTDKMLSIVNELMLSGVKIGQINAQLKTDEHGNPINTMLAQALEKTASMIQQYSNNYNTGVLYIDKAFANEKNKDNYFGLINMMNSTDVTSITEDDVKAFNDGVRGIRTDMQSVYTALKELDSIIKEGDEISDKKAEKVVEEAKKVVEETKPANPLMARLKGAEVEETPTVSETKSEQKEPNKPKNPLAARLASAQSEISILDDVKSSEQDKENSNNNKC